MSIGSVTIREAINHGENIIVLPSRGIHILSLALLIILLLLGFSLWNFLLIPSGVVASLTYTTLATRRWRAWAYQHVGDIHQFQRTAELAGLLIRQSHERVGHFISRHQREKLQALLCRFSGPQIFFDDLSVSSDTFIYANTLSPGPEGPAIILSNSGIRIQTGEFFEWNQINDDRIAQISYSRMSERTGADISAGSKDFFRFECTKGRFEIPLSSLKISAWELDLLTYIYRGRYNGSRKS